MRKIFFFLFAHCKMLRDWIARKRMWTAFTGNKNCDIIVSTKIYRQLHHFRILRRKDALLLREWESTEWAMRTRERVYIKIPSSTAWPLIIQNRTLNACGLVSEVKRAFIRFCYRTLKKKCINFLVFISRLYKPSFALSGQLHHEGKCWVSCPTSNKISLHFLKRRKLITFL